jgi:predicted porin
VKLPMKHRRALALAALALATVGTAQAQSGVQVYGVLDMMAYRKQLAGETAISRVDSGGLNTSHWGLRGSEDLGGGMRALFDISGFVRVDSGAAGRSDTDAFFGRYSWVGLQGGWGSVRLGRQTTPGMLNLFRYGAFNSSAGFGPSMMHNYLPSAAQPMMTGSGATDSAWNNVVSYTSPAFAGFVGTVHLAPSEGTSAGRRAAGGLVYSSGPFSTGIALETIHRMSLNFSKPPASVLMTDSEVLNWGASYDFGVAKLFSQFIRTELRNAATAIDLDSYNLGATVPIGAGRVLASYGVTTKTQTAQADQKRRTLSLGYDHALSIRSSIYAVVINDRVTGRSNGTGVALGVKHSF